MTTKHMDSDVVLNRRGLLAGGAGIVGATMLAGQARAQTASADAPAAGTPGPDYVLRNAMVLTLDPDLGDFRRADIHVKDGVIVAIGPDLAAPGAEEIASEGMIAMPGMIDTHWHMWNTLFKNMIRDGAEGYRSGRGYHPLKSGLGPHHQPEDYYAAVRLAMTEALDAGITTVVNYAHNTQSPAHTDAEIRAMTESGLRGRYAYGGPDPAPAGQTIDFAEVERVRRDWFGGGNDWNGRVDFGFCRGNSGSNFDTYIQELKYAKDNGLPVVLHTGTSLSAHLSPIKLDQAGYLDDSMLFVHSTMFNTAERALLVEKGITNSFSLGTEMGVELPNIGADVRQQFMLQVRDGINVSLSCDATSVIPTSMFEQMRFAYNIGTGRGLTATDGVPRIGRQQLIAMATLNGARGMGLGTVTGSLTPGKQADIVLLRATDLNMAPVSDIDITVVMSGSVRNVDTVIVDGRFLKRGGKILSVDVEEVRLGAIESLRNIRNRAGGDFTVAADESPLY